MNDQILIFLFVAGAIGLLAYAVIAMMGSGGNGKLRDRLVGKSENDATQSNERKGMVPLLKKMGNVAAEPFMPKTREAQSELRTRLGYAGIYTSSSLKLLTGAKVIALGIGLIGGYFLCQFVDGIFMQMAAPVHRWIDRIPGTNCLVKDGHKVQSKGFNTRPG